MDHYYLIYANDIIIDIKSDIYLYADDTILMIVLRHPILDIADINVDLETLNQWAAQWAVSFSPVKTEFMIFSRRLAQIEYNPICMDHTPVTRVSEHCHLGLTFTENLTWNQHVRSRIHKAAPALNMLIRNSVRLPRPVKECISRSFI